MSQAHLGKRIKHALKLSECMTPILQSRVRMKDNRPNTGNRITPYQFKELYGLIGTYPDNQSLSSLESSDESVNLAAEQERTRRSDEIKARLDAKKAGESIYDRTDR
jgi:hypothetical protein